MFAERLHQDFGDTMLAASRPSSSFCLLSDPDCSPRRKQLPPSAARPREDGRGVERDDLDGIESPPAHSLASQRVEASFRQANVPGALDDPVAGGRGPEGGPGALGPHRSLQQQCGRRALSVSFARAPERWAGLPVRRSKAADRVPEGSPGRRPESAPGDLSEERQIFRQGSPGRAKDDGGRRGGRGEIFPQGEGEHARPRAPDFELGCGGCREAPAGRDASDRAGHRSGF